MREFGDNARASKQTNEALDAYLESLEISRKVRKQIDIPDTTVDLIISLIRTGNVMRELGNDLDAREMYLEGLSIARSLTQTSTAPYHLCILLYALVKTANVHYALREDASSNRLAQNAVEVYKMISDHYVDHDDLRDLWYIVALVDERSGNLDEAKKSIALSLEYSEVLLKLESTPLSRSIHEDVLSAQERITSQT